MKSVFIAILQILIPAWLCLPAPGITQDESDFAGDYWINVVQTGQSSYLLNVTITAGEALEVRTVRVPSLVDFSELPAVETISTGTESTIGYPVKFTGEGRDSLWISVHSQDDADKVSYLVFELFNEVRGDQVRPEVESTAARWRAYGGSESVMQFGRTAARCGDKLASAATESGIFSPQNAVSGVMLRGMAAKLDGGIESFDSSGWGLKFAADKKLRVATFYRARELQAGQVGDDAQETEQLGGDERSGEGADERGSTSDSRGADNTRDPSGSGSGGDRGTQPASGPYSGSGAVARIVNLSVNKTWSPDSQGEGHFGETLVKLPQQAGRLKTIERIELTLRIKPRGAGPGKGRIFISTKRTLPSGSSGGEGSFWFADRFDQQGNFLGEFDTEFGSPEYKFDITEWAGANKADAYYVSILNLSRVPLDIEDIRLNLKGVR